MHSTVSLAIPSEIPFHCDDAVRYFIPRWIYSHDTNRQKMENRAVIILSKNRNIRSRSKHGTTLMSFWVKNAAKSCERSSYERYTTVFNRSVTRNGNEEKSHLLDR